MNDNSTFSQPPYDLDTKGTRTMKAMVRLAKQVYKGDKSGHDFGHIKRVLKYSKTIWKHEHIGGDFTTIKISVLFHDVHRIMQNKSGIYTPPEDSIEEVKKLLQRFNLKPKVLKDVLYIIKNHSNEEIETTMPELKIVQDADTLDAMGKRALKRSKKYCIAHGIPITNSAVPLDTPEYIPDVNPISSQHYVYRTMIPQAQMLQTKTAQKLASTKIKALLKFANKK